MILAILVLVVSVLFGVVFASRFDFINSFLEKLAFGIPIGITVFTLMLIGFDALLGSITLITTSMTTLVLLVLSYVLFATSGKRYARYFSLDKPYNVPKGVFAAFVLIFAFLFIWYFTSMYQGANGVLICRNNAACSDLLYHAGIGASVVYHSFPPQFPFTVKAVNVFPFIFDTYSMLLFKYGFTLYESTISTAILMLVSLAALSALLAYKLTKSTVATVAALFIFWFGASYIVAAAYYLAASFVNVPSVLSALPPISGPLAFIYINYTTFHYSYLAALSGAYITSWAPILNTMLMPQRDFLLGLAMGFAIIYLVYYLLFEAKRKKVWDILLLGFLVGLMPLVHPPTLIVLAIILAFALFYRLFSKNGAKKLKEELLLVIPALAVGLPQLYYMSLQRLGPDWYRFVYSSWIIYSGNLALTVLETVVYFFSYWTELMGLSFLLAFAGLYVCKDKRLRLFSIPFFATILFVMIFSPQPNPSDSNKMALYAFFMLAVLTGVFVSWLYKKKNAAFKALAIAIVVLISGNSIMVYYQSTLNSGSYVLISSAELNASEFIRNSTPSGAIFAVSNPIYLQNQPISTLGARQTLLSEEPYVEIEEHTYSIGTLEQANNQIFQTGDCHTLESFNVSYVYVMSSNPANLTPFENSNFSTVFTQHDSQLYTNLTIFKSMCR